MNSSESELVLNKDGSVYHLHLKAENVANHVILVGDPGRVKLVSDCFDQIEFQVSNREFVTHTGTFKGVRFTVISTGIGTDNIDIVVNELDAAVNMNTTTRLPNKELRQLNLIRIGTCGSVSPKIDIESIVVTQFSIGLDGIQHFYDIQSNSNETALEQRFNAFMKWKPNMNQPYASEADHMLLDLFAPVGATGITIAANGFFGPQGRMIRIPLSNPDINGKLAQFEHESLMILNYEMESSALYSLGKALGHRCLCCCVVVANRTKGNFSKNYQPAIQNLIQISLNICLSIIKSN
jgi:uridine phosphorylase